MKASWNKTTKNRPRDESLVGLQGLGKGMFALLREKGREVAGSPSQPKIR